MISSSTGEPEREAGNTVHKAARVLLFSENVLQQFRRAVSDLWLVANISRSRYRDAKSHNARHLVERPKVLASDGEGIDCREASGARAPPPHSVPRRGALRISRCGPLSEACRSGTADCPFAPLPRRRRTARAALGSWIPSSLSFCSAVEGWFFVGVLINLFGLCSEPLTICRCERRRRRAAPLP